jgi:predicted metal-dependent peptidase
LTSAGEQRLDTEKMAAARLWAASRFPYLASALFAQVVHARADANTIAVDRSWHLLVDPSLADSLATEELGRLLVHLTGHLLRDHATRAIAINADAEGSREQWNRATDAEINDDLVVDDCVPHSAPDLPGSLRCRDGGLAEQYFADGEPGVRRWDCGSGCDGSERPWDGGDGVDRERAQLVRMGVAAEVQRHHGLHPGTVPGGWLRWAEQMLPSQVDWRRVLAAEIRSGLAVTSGKVDYTYRRPSRRASVVDDVLLPALVRPIPNVAVVCDTSGSMHEQLLARALAEVEGLLVRAGLRSAHLRVLAVDVNVHAVRRVSRVSQVELAGGGGTDMGAGILAAAALKPRPSVIVVLTDGFTPWPEAAPKGTRVVIGLLEQEGHMMGPFASPPSWARVVRIPPFR